MRPRTGPSKLSWGAIEQGGCRTPPSRSRLEAMTNLAEVLTHPQRALPIVRVAAHMAWTGQVGEAYSMIVTGAFA